MTLDPCQIQEETKYFGPRGPKNCLPNAWEIFPEKVRKECQIESHQNPEENTSTQNFSKFDWIFDKVKKFFARSVKASHNFLN